MGRQHGLTLVELMIGLAIVAMLMMIALPNFTATLQNQQIKSATENTLQGLNLARAEALRRNMAVRFQFVSDMTSSCTLSSTSLSWVVSLASPAGLCDKAPVDSSDAGAPTGSDPKIVQKMLATEAGANVAGTSFLANGTTAANTITFTGLGRVSGAGMAWIDIKNTTAACEHESGSLRCLRILVSTGGQPKVCDPKVTVATDPRHCS